MKNKGRNFLDKVTESCANKLINIGQKHCDSSSFLISYCEPKLSERLVNEINKNLK